MQLRKCQPEDWQLTHYPTPFFKKELSNIPQALELSQQITQPKIRPSIAHTKKNKIKAQNKSQVTLQNRLKKILQSKQPNYRSHNTSRSNKNFTSDRKQKQIYQKGTVSKIMEYSNTHSPQKNRHSQLPVISGLTSVHKNRNKKNKSVLDIILNDRDQYAKAYFNDLSRIERINQKQKNKNQQQKIDENDGDIEFQFPEISTGIWKVKGFIKDQYILLRGNSKAGKEIIKKYQYEKVYPKLRKDYQSWVQLKFSFQN